MNIDYVIPGYILKTINEMVKKVFTVSQIFTVVLNKNNEMEKFKLILLSTC